MSFNDALHAKKNPVPLAAIKEYWNLTPEEREQRLKETLEADPAATLAAATKAFNGFKEDNAVTWIERANGGFLVVSDDWSTKEGGYFSPKETLDLVAAWRFARERSAFPVLRTALKGPRGKLP